MRFNLTTNSRQHKNTEDLSTMLCCCAALVCFAVAFADMAARPAEMSAQPEEKPLRVTRKILTRNTASVYFDMNGDDVSDGVFWEHFEHGVPESYSNVVEKTAATKAEWKKQFPKAIWEVHHQKR